MSKPDKSRINDVFFEKFKDRWVVSSRSTFEAGRGRIEIPPTRFIPLEDKQQLKNVLRTILDEEVSVIPMAVFEASDFALDDSHKLSPLGIKSTRTFYKHSRGFWLKRSGESLKVQEWKKFKGGGYSGVLWSKEFKPDDFENLVNYLVEKVKNEPNGSGLML